MQLKRGGQGEIQKEDHKIICKNVLILQIFGFTSFALKDIKLYVSCCLDILNLTALSFL